MEWVCLCPFEKPEKIMAQNSQKFLQVVLKDDALNFIMGNGKMLCCAPAALSPEMQNAAMLHGLNQKVRDSAAGFSKDNDYNGAMLAMSSTWETLQSGLWNARGGASGESDLAAAVSNLKKITIEAATQAIGALDEDQLKVLRSKPTVKAELLRIKAERAAKVAGASDEDEDILDL